MTQLLAQTSLSKEVSILSIAVISALLAIVTYAGLYAYYEKREVTEFSAKGFTKNTITGIIIGLLLQSLTILVIYLNGGYSVVAVNNFLCVLPALGMAFSSAIVEEIVFRGIIFRIIEDRFGTYIALIASALIFGLLHLANPNSSFIAAVGLAIQAGLLLATAYVYARNLWFPIGIHFAWNFTQAGIFGAVVSGNSVGKSLLTAKIRGADWFTGGQFGPEGSVQATVFCLIATAILLAPLIRQKKIVN